MSDAPPDALRATIVVRGLVQPSRQAHGAGRPPEADPELVVFFDTETRIDASQRLLFGSARLHDREGFVREWLFFADDLDEAEHAVLRDYVERNADDRGGSIRLLPIGEFTRLVLGRLAYKERPRVVGFNLPFDLSRLAIDWRPGGGEFTGGFSLQLFESVDEEGTAHRDKFLPNIRIKSLGSKRQRIGFAAPLQADPERLIQGRHFRGRFLDLRQLTDSLTDRSYTLDGAAAAFGVGERKAATGEHGRLTARYIDYNRQDVRTTAALYDALIAEWRTHPIDLEPERSFSAATVGRAYLRAMGVAPPLAKASGVTPERMGQAMSAYFGGRAEVRTRLVPMPIRYVDFTSMYPTAFELFGFWSWVTAESFGTEDATDAARAFVARIDRKGLFDRAVWPEMAGVFCLVQPRGELLPVRADYGADPTKPGAAMGAPTIGVNPFWSAQPLWYALADVVSTKILGGRAPEILEAFRIVPEGVQTGLLTVKLRGQIEVDPRTDSLFRVAIEERNRIRQRTDLPAEEIARTSQFLKTLANADAYGIFAQVDVKEPTAAGFDVQIDGLWSFKTHVPALETPGAYCFPPLAATITAGGRLLLALLEAEVEARGGSYLACDTDSLLIVASRSGGLIRCPNGPHELPNAERALRALSDPEVLEIVERFASLSPYDPAAVRSLLKIEDENYAEDDPTTLVDLWGIGISAKRFCLYERHGDRIVIRKASEHGLGLYRPPLANPLGWDKPWRFWVEIVWQRVIASVEGRPVGRRPSWFRLPAVGQIAMTTWRMLTPFGRHDGPPAHRVRPFNFMLVGHADPLVPKPVELGSVVTPVAPFSSKPEEFLGLAWRNRIDGQRLSVTTEPGGAVDAVRLKTYDDVVRDYRWHPERKSGDPAGGVGLRTSTGLLPRRPIVAVGIRHIGKETNRLDEVEEGLLDVEEDVHLQYVDERGEWERVRPALRAIGVKELARRTGISERTLRSQLNSGRLPRKETRQRLAKQVALPEPPFG